MGFFPLRALMARVMCPTSVASHKISKPFFFTWHAHGAISLETGHVWGGGPCCALTCSNKCPTSPSSVKYTPRANTDGIPFVGRCRRLKTCCSSASRWRQPAKSERKKKKREVLTILFKDKRVPSLFNRVENVKLYSFWSFNENATTTRKLFHIRTKPNLRG